MKGLRRRLPPANSLIFFEAAARHLNFTTAAEELHVTQAAVSRQIRLLEDHVGCDLFDRDQGRVQLTAQGRAYREAVEDSLEHIARITRRVGVEDAANAVTIACHVAVASCWLTPILDQFLDEHADVLVRQIATDRRIDMFAEGVDLAIRFGYQDASWPGLEAVRLIDEEIFPVAAPDYLAKSPGLEGPADLARHRLLQLDAKGPQWTDWPTWLGEFGMDAVGALIGPRFDNYASMIEAARCGHGVALGWRTLMDRDLNSGRLVRPMEEVVRTSRSYFLVSRAGEELSEPVSAFRGWLASVAPVASRRSRRGGRHRPVGT